MSRNDRITRKPLLNPGGDSNQTELPHSEEKQYPFVHTTSDAASQEIIAQNNAHGGRPKSSLANGWNFEILSCLLAVVALVGLVVTLWKHENRPLPQWPRIVTINSIISIFTLLIRTGVCFILAEGISQTKWQWFQKPRKLEDMERFDAASRSGWGSFLLLIKVNRRPHWIAALGSVAMIMASLLGFFTQQLVVFQDCLQKDPQANVGVWKTNNFNITGMSTGNGKADLYTPMVAAINVGIIQPVNDLTSVLSDSCVTGNCTFPGSDSGSFSTVGLGYTCTDITSQLVYAGNSTNSTVSLNMSSLSSNKPLVIGNKASPIVLTTGAISGSLDNSGSLVTVKMMYRKSFDQANVSAINCAIFPEVQTYHVNITKGKLVETLVDSVQIGRNALPVIRPYTFSYDLWTSHKRATSYVLRNGTKQFCDRKPTNSSAFPEPVAEINIDNIPDPQVAPKANTSSVWYFPQDCVYQIGKITGEGFADYMGELFTDQRLQVAGRLGGNAGSVHLRQLFQNGNMSLSSVDKIFRNLTTAMTAVVRTSGAEGSAWEARGEMWYSTTCMKIEWHWIAFPAIMIGLTIIFLALVAIESRGVQKDRLWKSSVLATLFCEVDIAKTSEDQIVDKHAMVKTASSTSVSIDKSGGRLRLVGT